MTATDSADLLGKAASALQQDIAVGDDAITGTLKYVTGYTGFSGDSEEQSGNYLALYAATSGADGATITLELIGGRHPGAKPLDPDGLMVIRITDKSSQKVKIVASKEGYMTRTKEFDLSGLTLLSA